MNGAMTSPQMKAGMRPKGSSTAKWIPSRMTTNLKRRWPPGAGGPSHMSAPASSSLGRQLTGYGAGPALVIESSAQSNGYAHGSSKPVHRQLTGYDSNGMPTQQPQTRQAPPSSNGNHTAASSNGPSARPANKQMATRAQPYAPPVEPEAEPKPEIPTPTVAPVEAPAPMAPPSNQSNGLPPVNSSHAVVAKKEVQKPPSSSSYKFIYFNLRARGEVSRLLFAAAGQKYENEIFDAPPDFQLTEFWNAREQNPDRYPYGQLPILEVDGETISQSHAIERFLADRFGFLGEPGSVQRAQIDAVVEHCNDIFNKFISHVFSEDKDERLIKHYNEYFPQKCDFLEAHLQKNGTGWMVGDSMTLADIAVYQNVLMTGVPDYVRQSLEGFNPMLLALGERVETNPGIARWLDERPDTFF